MTKYLACVLCLFLVCCTVPASGAQLGKALQVSVVDGHANLLSGATVAVGSDDGSMIKAEPLPDGTHFIAGVGTKVSLEVSHPDQGEAFVELLLPVGVADNFVTVIWTDEGAFATTPGPSTSVLNPVPGRETLDASLGGGDDCSTATVIPSLPFSDTGSTVGAADDYDEICSFNTPGSGDVVYAYTPATTGAISVSLCGNSDYDTKLYIYENVCGPYQGGTSIACNDDSCSTPSFPSAFVSSLEAVPVAAGNTYFIVVDGYGGEEGNYTIDVTEFELCDVVCPPGAVLENEADCGVPDDTVNGGCNSIPALFSDLFCGDTVCGTSAWNGSTRDTDWYQVTVAVPTIFTWSVEAEFDVVIGMVETFTPGSGDCNDSTGSLNPFAVAGDCEVVSVTTDPLPAGTYWFFVAPDFNGATFPCGLEYTATITCEDAPTTGACCFADGSCMDLSEEDCGTMGGVFEGLGTECATFNCPVVPENDLCVNAIGPLAVPSMTMGTTEAATIDSDAPFCGTGVTSPGVWYTVTGTGTTMAASTCGPFFGYDTKISVYCGDCEDLVCIDGNDDNCSGGASGLLSTVSWCSQTGATYYILVHGFGGGSGDFELYIDEDGAACEPDVLCIPLGACCFPDVFGTCMVMTEAECVAYGGTYQGDDTDCGGAFSYMVEDCGNAFEDISGSGMDGPVGDDAGSTVPLGFTFTFFGDDHTEIGMSTNGYLTFGSDLTDFSNDPIPTDFDPNDLIAPLWDDYVVDSSGQTFYATMGSAPDRMFIAQWTGIRQFGNSDSNTFQAVLYEGSNCVEFRYGDFTPEGFSGDYTAGVENQDGTMGYSVDAAALMPGDCVSFCPEVSENPCPAVLPLDIKPGSCPNSFNPGSQGKLPVGLLGTMDFDISMVDVNSIMMSRMDGTGGSVAPIMGSGPGPKYDDVGTPFDGDLCDCHELEGDGYTDLSLKFNSPGVTAALELGDMPHNTYVEVMLSGYLNDGMAFVAYDCLRIVGNGGGHQLGIGLGRSNDTGLKSK